MALNNLMEELKVNSEDSELPSSIKEIMEQSHSVCAELMVANRQIQQNYDELKREQQRIHSLKKSKLKNRFNRR